MRQPKIGIWGPFNTGKTSYLGALYLEMRHAKSKWNMAPFDGDNLSQDFAKQIIKSLKQGLFPQATLIGARYGFNISHKLNRFRDRNKKYSLVLIDAAGALSQTDSPVNPDTVKDYYQYLQQCDGLFIIIDPEAPNRSSNDSNYESYSEMIRSLVTRLNYDWDTNSESINKVAIHIAICITKMDLDHNWERRNDLTNLLIDIIGNESYELLISSIDKGYLEIFGVSAAGRYTTRGGLERPNIMMTSQGVIKLAKVERAPYGITEPLLWLFDQIDKNTLTRLERMMRRPPSNDPVQY